MAESPTFQSLTLEQAATHLLEECRMVLPGIQALLGFQLVAVFSATFATRLTYAERLMHVGAIVCVVVAVALVMSPAVLHRRCEPDGVSRRFLRVSSRLLMWSMGPLALATCLDVYVVARAASGDTALAIIAAVIGATAFVGLWLVLPNRLRLP